MPNCYTCGEEITFDRNILSKTGKQIPLTLDKKFSHGHDEQGQPVNKPLTQQQQPNYPPPLERQPARIKPTIATITGGSGQSQGGSYLDTKRLRVMVEEIGKKQQEDSETINAVHALARNNSTMLSELMQHFKLVEPTTAAALAGKVHGWNSVPNPTDKQQQQEQQNDFPIEKTLTDDDDDDDESELQKEGI